MFERESIVCCTGDKFVNISRSYQTIQIPVHFVNLSVIVFLVLKPLAFLLLSSSFLFEFLLFPPLCSSTTYPPHLHRVHSLVCVLSMPRKREGLESVKTRLVKEQKLRTERRIQDLLHPRQAFEEIEVKRTL